MRTRTARVILVNWKNAPLTLRAAHSIAPQMGEGDHLVIVDNGSDDDSLSVLRDGLEELRGAADPARVSLVNAGTNDGFGAGVMAGAAGLSEGAVVLLNNDATARDGFLDALLAPLGETVGATTALILLTGTWRPATASDTHVLVARDGSRWARVGEEEPAGRVLINSTGNEVDPAGNGYDRSWLDHEHAASSGTSSPMFLRVNARNRIIVAAQHAPWGVVARAVARSLARALRFGGRGPVARGVFQGLLALPRALRHRTASRS